MNKLTKGLLTASLAATLVFGAACATNGSSDVWKGTDFTNYGVVDSDTLGGFIAETANYVYFINGIGTSSSDNTFGIPIKGALVAADKSDLSKTSVVIPELFVASDYNSGLFISGSGEETYAYYGTPNKEKDSSGAVAYTEMTFTKTRLDGRKSEKLFTVSSLSTNYRIAKGEDGAVYIVYYDTENSALVSYNCDTKKSTTIAKTDAKTNETTDGEYLSLGEYKFLGTDNAAQVVFTMTVYSQKYYSEAEEREDSYSRATAAYNYVYAYTAGKDAEKILDGKTAGDMTYALTSNVGQYLFYTQTKVGGSAVTYAIDLTGESSAVKLDYPNNVKDGMIVKSLSEIYYADGNKVIRTALVKTSTDPQEEFNNLNIVIANDESISSLVSVDEDYIYYYNSERYVYALRRADDIIIRVTKTAVSSGWYAPEIVSIDSGDYMLYSDGSTEGNSYIYYSDVSGLSDPLTELNDDGEVEVYYLECSFVGVMPAADRAAAAISAINAIESTLTFKEGDEGALYSESVKTARAAYDALKNDPDAKACVGSSYVTKLETAEKAVVLANAFNKLEPVLNYNFLTETEKETLAADYETAKELVEGYGNDYSSVAGYLDNNFKYLYQQTGKKLEPATDSENA